MPNLSKFMLVLLAAGIAACASGSEGTKTPSPKVDRDDPLAGLGQPLTALATPCTFVAASGLMTVTVAAGETAVIARSAADATILQNGQTCDNVATATTVKKIVITGSAGLDTVVLDFTNGLFATGTTSTATTGIVVDLAGGATDTLAIKGTSSADTFTFGATALLLNADLYKDVTVANVETFVVSLGDGDDTYSGAGSAVAGAVFPTAISVYGGPGADTFVQGAASTPNETISGGTGIDTVSYALRNAIVTVTVGAGVDDGVALEADDIQNDVEVVTGGTLGDSLTAEPATAVTLNGGPGNDTLIGSSANDTLNGDAGDDTLRGGDGNDILNGGAGNDTFDEETATNGGDIMTGGDGTDLVDYSARTVALVVTMDGSAANDGEADEKDNVKADVENIKGGSGNDTITGNGLSNVIDGGLGDDVLSGGLGDDTFPQGAVPDGNDTINGGGGVDLVTYALRTAAITVVMDGATPSGDTGAAEADLIGLDVENLYGGTVADDLTGNALGNEIVGNGGDDVINGLGGDDTLEGGAGDDTVNCGTGFDVSVGRVGTDVINVDCEI